MEFFDISSLLRSTRWAANLRSPKRKADPIVLKMQPRCALRLVVVLPVLLVALVGCSAAGSGGGTDAGSVSGAPSESPVSPAGLQCDAVAKSFDAQAKSQGVKRTYIAVDPLTIIGVQGLPATVLNTGCFVSADQKFAHVLIPASESTTFAALATILTASGYVSDDSGNTIPGKEHSFYSSDKSVPQSAYQVGALDLLTVDQLARNELPADLFNENDGPMLYVSAGIR